MSKKNDKTYDQMVKQVLDFHPKWKNPVYRKEFSDYIISKVVSDFLYDPKIKGSLLEKKKKVKELYISLMESYEKQAVKGEENEQHDS